MAPERQAAQHPLPLHKSSHLLGSHGFDFGERPTRTLYFRVAESRTSSDICEVFVEEFGQRLQQPIRHRTLGPERFLQFNIVVDDYAYI